MGEITEALRANLRELALSDARLMREAEAGSASAAVALDDGLDRMGLKELRALGKERGFKGLTRHKKDELIALLRGGDPAPAAAPTRALKASAPSLTALEERLERMEGLLQRIAARLEVS
jgi:hypothetical protein